MSIIERVGVAASIIMPLWNIPLILRIVQRRSAKDISKAWVFGVWICVLLMAPSGFVSQDMAWRCFNIVNLVLFTGVVVAVVRFHK